MFIILNIPFLLFKFKFVDFKKFPWNISAIAKNFYFHLPSQVLVLVSHTKLVVSPHAAEEQTAFWTEK